MLLILKNKILKIYLWVKIKIMRKRLHIALDTGDESSILEISKQLDEIILKYIKI